jgi:integrase
VSQVCVRPIGFHECRHSYSSFLDAAGVSEVRADRYMGHSNYSMRARYTHQLEAQLAEDAQRLDDYLRGAAAGKVVLLDAERRSA